MIRTLTGFFSAAAILLAPATAAEFETKRCVNIGNALDAPSEGAWGHEIRRDYLTAIGETTLDTIRLPVRWSAHTSDEASWTIDPDFMARVDEVIGWAMEEDLIVILNIHHFNEMNSAPAASMDKYISLWEQIANHYKDYPATLYFEVLNEPNDKLEGEPYRQAMLKGVETIRKTNPERILILGGENWNGHASLKTIPAIEGDDNIVHTFHYYLPFEFTHQRTEWTDLPPDRVVEWGSEQDYLGLNGDIEYARVQGEDAGRPLLLGEYGVNGKVDLDQRVKWTKATREFADDHNIPACVWSFTATFPVWDRETREWLPGMKDALGITDKPE